MDIYDGCRKGNDQPLHLFLVGSTMEVQEYYRLVDAFLCMSEAEGFGMSLVEAMFYQVPVLAYEAEAVPETLGGSGVLLPTWQPSEVAGVVRTVLQNQNTRHQILEGQNRRL